MFPASRTWLWSHEVWLLLAGRCNIRLVIWLFHVWCHVECVICQPKERVTREDINPWLVADVMLDKRAD